MKNAMVLIEFQCGECRFAIPLVSVRRVIPSAQPTPLPGAPEIVLGMLNLCDEIAIIINFNRRVGLDFSGIKVTQKILLLNISAACIGLVVDRVCGIVTRQIDIGLYIPDKFAADACVTTVIRLEDGLCVICDPEKFLLDEENALLADALDQLTHAAH